ncbi:hypothetical protein Pla52n_37090 [Stieleria varia]|uniref:Uncharacterized protein n=1 Tax=Stieleria varia TaxID=2528005 RepID=A0A5C6AUG0_9BACT|nr:hypothetical protein Pla52n_37090 [Stieleria varia]
MYPDDCRIDNSVVGLDSFIASVGLAPDWSKISVDTAIFVNVFVPPVAIKVSLRR